MTKQVLFLFVLALARPLWASGPADLSDQAEDIRRSLDVPALALIATDERATIAVGVAGVRAAGSDTPARRADAFHLGSLTKSMTAVVAARMVERGRIAWDTTVADASPGLAAAVPERARSITLEQLLAHRSGMPDDRSDGPLIMALWQIEGGDAGIAEKRAEAARRLLARDTLGEPGAGFAYSNGNYIVAGHMLEAVAGRPWEDLLREELTEPLGLEGVGHGAPGSDAGPAPDGPPAHALGHARTPGRLVPVPPAIGADNPPVLGPAGRVHAPIDALGVYARAHLAGLRGADGILRAETWARLHRDPFDDENARYALGWALRDGVSMHAGSNSRWMAYITIDPDRNLGVGVVMNAVPAGGPGVDPFGMVIEALEAAGLIQTPAAEKPDTGAP